MNMSSSKTHNVIHMSLGSAILLAGLAVAIGGTILITGIRKEEQTPQRKILPRLGSVSSLASESVEAAYGPVNQAALTETKEGLLSRMRANIQTRRAYRQAGRAVVQSNRCWPFCDVQAYQPVQTVHVQSPVVYTRYSEPVYRVSHTVEPTAPYAPDITVEPVLEPLNANCPDCLDIQPSVGPVNKAALTETKQSIDDSEFALSEKHIDDSEFTSQPIVSEETPPEIEVDLADLPPTLTAPASPHVPCEIQVRAKPLPLFAPTGRFEIQPSE